MTKLARLICTARGIGVNESKIRYSSLALKCCLAGAHASKLTEWFFYLKLGKEIQGASRTEEPEKRQPILQHEESFPVCLLQAMDGRYVGMTQRRQQLGFPLKSGHPLRIFREGLRQHLMAT